MHQLQPFRQCVYTGGGCPHSRVDEVEQVERVDEVEQSRKAFLVRHSAL
jgi:hypothetical protein